ncbi:MAG: hypothetical protein H6Q08_688 [Acidobacteria bacterium]|nr:hypothetical protein [Acidobacteriota bacterium]
MEDRSRIAVSVLVGAALGGMLGYLLFTEGGRRARNSLRGQLEGLVDDASRFSGSIEKMRGVATEGWRGVKDVFSALSADEVPYDDPDRGMRVS